MAGMFLDVISPRFVRQQGRSAGGDLKRVRPIHIRRQGSAHVPDWLDSGFGLWLDSGLGFWILELGFWILEFGFWILEFGVPSDSKLVQF